MPVPGQVMNKLSRGMKGQDYGGKLAALITLVTNLHDVLLNHCMAKAGLVIGSGAATAVKIANTVTYCIAGILYTKTTAEVAFTPTTHDIAPNATLVREACYTLALDSAGTATLTKGPTVTGAGLAVPPAAPANTTAIGYVRIAVAAGATPFTGGTTLLSSGALTVTYYDLFARPQDVAAAVAAIAA